MVRVLTEDQYRALQDYAAKHGSRWKAMLMDSWMTGGGHGPVLQQVRNTFGPSWLGGFRFKQVEPVLDRETRAMLDAMRL
jgi:hypothetical protein